MAGKRTLLADNQPEVRETVKSRMIAFDTLGGISGAGDTTLAHRPVSLSPALHENECFVGHLLDAIPGFVFVVDANVSILNYNSAADRLLGLHGQDVLRRRAGDVLHCIHSHKAGGCGTGEFCRSCLIRSSVTRALASTKCIRNRVRLELISGDIQRDLYVLVSASALTHQGKPAVLLILDDVAELLQVQHPLLVCVQCKGVRPGNHSWKPLESYLEGHMDLRLNNGYCPECQAHQEKLAELRCRAARLTAREHEVFCLVVQGHLNKQIAASLGVAEKTIKIHRGRGMAKMGAQSVAELVHTASCLGLHVGENSGSREASYS